MRHTSIYLTDVLSTERALAKKNGLPLAHRLTYIVERYREICRRHRPDLTQAEWALLGAALNGVDYTSSATMIGGLWVVVDDAIQRGKLDEKYGVDGPSLIERLRNLDYASCVATLETVEQGDVEDDAAYVAWVPDPGRVGGYSYLGVIKDGGKIIKRCDEEEGAHTIVSQLQNETMGAAGGYIVVWNDRR